MLAPEPADAAAERQADKARVAVDARRCRQAMRLTCDVEIGEQRAAFSARRSGFGIDGDASHPGEVDHKTVLAERLSGDVVPASPNGHG